jgi:GNAT superfamily N-acetyltransferase
MKIVVMEYSDIEKQKDLTFFINIIYNNFIEFANDYKLMHSKEKIEEGLRKEGSIIILLMNDLNKIIGFSTGNIMVLDDHRKVLHVSYIYVAESERDKKLGAMLLAETEKIAYINKCIGITLIFDTHQDKLVRFYENRGYMLDINLRRYERYDVFYKIL